MAKEGEERSLSVKGVPDDPLGITEHHRKPTSKHGHRYDKRNISRVPRFKHSAWHDLYENLEAEEIILLFKDDYEMYGIDYEKPPLFKKWCEGVANSTREKIKRTKAWYVLFEGKTITEIVEEINTVWLDPEYKINIGIKRIPVIQIQHQKIPYPNGG